jgi:hypothetical protein
MRAALSEGFANWFALALTETTDMVNTTPDYTTRVNLIDLPSQDIYDGWFNETAITKLLYAISNNTNGITEGSNELVLSNIRKLKDDPYFTSIFSLLSEIKENDPNVITQASSYMNSIGINATNKVGLGESATVNSLVIQNNDIATTEYLPIYRDFGIGKTTQACVQTAIGGEGKLGFYNFGYLETEFEGRVSISATGNKNDIIIWFPSNNGKNDTSAILPPDGTFDLELNSNHRRLWVADLKITGIDAHECFNITINSL